ISLSELPRETVFGLRESTGKLPVPCSGVRGSFESSVAWDQVYAPPICKPCESCLVTVACRALYFESAFVLVMFDGGKLAAVCSAVSRMDGGITSVPGLLIPPYNAEPLITPCGSPGRQPPCATHEAMFCCIRAGSGGTASRIRITCVA